MSDVVDFWTWASPPSVSVAWWQWLIAAVVVGWLTYRYYLSRIFRR